MLTTFQNPLTVIAEISPGQQPALDELLTKLGQNPADSVGFPLAQVATLHFSCFVIVPADAPYPPSLLLEANFDGEPDAYLNELIAVGLDGLRAIYGHCTGFPTQATAAQVKDFLRAHSVPSAAFYVGCRGQSVQSLRNAIAVREAVESFVDQEQAAGKIGGLSPRQIVERIQAHLGSPGVVSPEPSQVTVDELAQQAKRNTLILVLIAIPLVLLFLPLILIWALLLRLVEYRDTHAQPPPALPIDPRLFTHPDIHAQSHLTAMSTVRGGPIRALTLKFVLWVTQLLARTVSIDGNLLGIPTIHFARWAMMDNDKRMVFFSNYDGSWSSYLGDFVDKAKYGLTAIWGNTDRFPPSKWLAFGGAALMNPFKEWSLEHNLYAPFYYRAYPSATVANLLNDLRIRDTVGRVMSDSEAAAFLKLL